MAVAIEVPGGDAHSVANRLNAGLVRRVDETKLTGLDELVPEQAVPSGSGGASAGGNVRFEFRPLHEVGVQVAIAVRVEESGARTHDLGQQVAAARAVPVLEDEAELGCAVAKRGSVRQRRGSARSRRLRAVAERWGVPAVQDSCAPEQDRGGREA